MPKTYEWESEEYKKTLIFGPGLKIQYTATLKTYEENFAYRKKEKLDVYDDNDVLLGFARRFTDMWQCCLLITVINTNGEYNRDMPEINRLAKEKGIDIPELNSTLHHSTRTYYTWNSKKTGFFIRNKINEEIKQVAINLRKLNFVPVSRVENSEMERI